MILSFFHIISIIIIIGLLYLSFFLFNSFVLYSFIQILYKYYKQYTFIYSYNYLAKGSQGVKYKYSTISFFRGKKMKKPYPCTHLKLIRTLTNYLICLQNYMESFILALKKSIIE